MKNPALKYLTPAMAGICLGLLPNNTQAQTTPVFNYGFPASWNGTGTTITDLSSAGNNGFYDGTLSLAAAPGGSSGNSVNTTAGGILTTATGSLNNASVATAGGFTMNVDFMWNGTDSTSFGHTQKLIDYAGTESLQLVTTTGSASLQMAIANESTNEITAVSYTISPNTWYDVTLTFNSSGNSVDANGGLSGITDLYVDGSLVSTASAVKGDYGDTLDRQIGIGQLGANFGYLVGFKGDIYDPSVELGVAPVPEPSSLALSALGGLGFFGMMWKARRRKA